MNICATITLHAGGPGSGCKGPNCGRPRTNVFYHGTVEENVHSILNNGLIDKDNVGVVYTTTSKRMALTFGMMKTEDYHRQTKTRDRNNLPVALVVMKKSWKPSRVTGIQPIGIAKNIPPSMIDRVELYRFGDVAKLDNGVETPSPIKIIHADADDESGPYFVVVPPEMLLSQGKQ